MRWIPFTAHVRIVPAHGSGINKTKRFEIVRDMQKIATLMYDALEDESSINIAEPGGGQHQSFLGASRSGFGGLTRGMAAKPRIGETPAQTMITGFWDDSAANNEPHPEHTRISGGDQFTGNTATPWSQNPNSRVDTITASLKSTIESAFNSNLPSGITFEIFRLDVNGVIYGDRGYHFP